MKKLITLTACGVLAGLVVSSQAARIGFWDAAAPGSNPSTTWEDASGNGYHLTGFGVGESAAPAYDGSGSYDLNFNNGFVGTGDGLFDFETDKAGEGLGTPFSMNVYMSLDSWQFENGFTLVSKTSQGEDGQFTGYFWSGNGDDRNRFDVFMQPGNNQDRNYHRIEADNAFPGGDAYTGADAMITLTHDGSGSLAGFNQYLNGALESPQGHAQDGLNGSILNDSPLRIGQPGTAFGGGHDRQGIDGNIYFVEIYDHELSAGEVAGRWNGGSPSRIPEPASLVLLGIGGSLLWLRRRS